MQRGSVLVNSRIAWVAGVALAAGGVANADTLIYTTTLSGAAEQTPNDSMGTGFSTVTIDTIAMTMRVEVTFAGLTGVTTASHIHGPTAVPFDGTAGVMTPTPTFPGFPLGVTAGSMDFTFDLSQSSSYNPSFVTAQGSVPDAMNALLGAFAEGRAYLNIHTTQYGAGEIRGFYIPSPSGGAMIAIGGLIAAQRRRN